MDRRKLEVYLERLEEETAQWARSHPLNPGEREEPGPPARSPFH